VIDDEQRFRDVLESGLVREGFAVRTTANGVSALALIQSWEPEAIVLDATVPVTDGFSVLAVVRSFSQVPILLVTLHEATRGSRQVPTTTRSSRSKLGGSRRACAARCGDRSCPSAWCMTRPAL
jgi:CheY-like chemotaxis protein